MLIVYTGCARNNLIVVRQFNVVLARAKGSNFIPSCMVS